ncbi:flavin reductase family protein [Beijerinckia mobilis]|uniref:flavin reductase family protein n=1 Tax=Beijerinckia mobilis TaxID=231434 RepID=UPI000557F82D|nr:flavin reductase family protein [Beijerinckia mobilis]
MSTSETLPASAAPDLVATFKTAMRRLAASVTVVTASKDKERFGITATAVTSVTTQPPAILVCVNRTTSVHSVLQLGTPFCVNLLHHQHVEISNAFGGFVKCDDKFAFGTWQDDEQSVPFLVDAQANLFCVVDGLFDYGTHTIVIGKVTSILTTGDVAPLIYQNGGYLGHGA